jgi:hypothetical protein
MLLETDSSRSLRSLAAGFLFFLATAGAIFFLLYLRRPDALNAPQFFAEDGMIFFHDQLLFGIRQALWIPHAGYVLAIQRLTAMLGGLFCPVYAPAVYNIAALTLSSSCCAFFSLPVFRSIVRSDLLRFAVCCLFAIALDSAELIGTITQIQWFLQLAGILLLIHCVIRGNRPRMGWQILEGLLVMVLALSCPLMVLAVPLTLWLLWTRKGLPQAAALLAVVAIQLAVYVQAGESRGQSSVFQMNDMLRSLFFYMTARPVLSSLVGRPLAMQLCDRNIWLYTALAGVLVVASLAWMWRKTDWSGRGKILGCLYFALSSGVLALGARKMLHAEKTITFGGERYFYLAACSFVVLVAIALEMLLPKAPAWTKPLALVALFGLGIAGNFRVPGFFPMHWDLYQDSLQDWTRDMRGGKPVTAIRIPINPTGWSVTLEGNVLSDGGFEDAVPFVWQPYGNATIQTAPGHAFDPYRQAAMQMSRLHSFEGRASLRVDGLNGGAEQMIRNLAPGRPYRITLMAFSECTLKADMRMLVQTMARHTLARMNATPAACGTWLPVETSFVAPSEGSVWLQLGNTDGLISYWDAVAVETGAPRLHARGEHR